MKKIDLNKLSKLDIILITLIIFSIGYVIGYFVHKANSTISSPVEMVSIDSLNNTNKDIDCSKYHLDIFIIKLNN